jgi:ferredoxin
MCSFTYAKSFNIAKSRINIDIATRAIEFSEECNNCGICAHYCAYGALMIDNQRRRTAHAEI